MNSMDVFRCQINLALYIYVYALVSKVIIFWFNSQNLRTFIILYLNILLSFSLYGLEINVANYRPDKIQPSGRQL